ncbi:MAG: CvpA family protein [Oscillospiraceae bacterium]|nr:CvpA family protein [Oscillospiraceae bacterium]
MGLIVNLAVLLFLGLSAYNGFRKGFFLTTASIVIFFASIIVGATLANNNVERTSGIFDSILDWVAEDATEEAIAKVSAGSRNLNEEQLDEVVGEAFEALGFSPKATGYLSEQVITTVRNQAAALLYETISKYFIRSLAWVALFFAGFAVCSLILSLIANFISTAFKLPVIRQLDMIGGIPLGLLKGVLVLMIIGFALRYYGFVIPDGVMDARLVRFFVDNNPFGNIIKL